MGTLVPTLLAVSGLLALVSLLPPLARRLRLPYTVLLAAVGVALGLSRLWITGSTADELGPAGDFLTALSDLELSSSAFLYIFLPVLLFETALSVDVRRLLDDLWPVMILAVVAVVLCTIIAGLGMAGAWWVWKGTLGTHAIIVCLTLAAIVATTDPAAVVGIFRDLGAPRRLSILVEGESLFNDAAAIALFTLLLGMLTARGPAGSMAEADWAGAALSFLVKFFGGIAVGVLMGWLVGIIVTPLRNLPQSEISLTVSLAYLAFIVAERYLEVSGVVAVVTAGLVIASEGRTRISPESWEGLRNVWGQLGFWANSLIFLLASMLIPPTLMEAQWGHMLLLAALVVCALLARALVIYGMLPGLTAIGAADRISGPYKAVMLWGGLRGAVSLALALAVTENRRVPEPTQEMVAVVATGFVLFTLFVQGTTLRPLIRLVGLNRLSPVEEALRNRALGLSLGRVRQDVETIARDFHMNPAPAVAPLLERGAELAQEQIDLDERHGGLSLDDRVYIGLSTLARREEELYLTLFRDGVISRRTVQSLVANAGRLQDGVKAARREGYEGAARKEVKLSRGLRRALWVQRRLGADRYLALKLSERFAQLVVVRIVVEGLKRFTDELLAPMLGRDAATTLTEVLKTRQAAIQEALDALRLQYPAYVEEVQVRYLTRAALRVEERTMRRLFDEAIISREILADLERDLRRRRAQVEEPPRLDLGLSTTELIGRVPLFAGLAPDRLGRIERLLRPSLAMPGEVLVRRGERGDSMYFISSGAVAVTLPGLAQPVRLGSGDFFGELALLDDRPRNADVVALAYCRLLVLDRRDFHSLLDEDADLRGHVEEIAAARRMPAAG